MNLAFLGLLSLVVVLLVVLVRAADLIEDAFVFLAHKIKVREFAIGFFILSFVSSLPEFSIALSSNDSTPELSIGNLFGATVILLTLVVGLTAIKFGSIELTHRFGPKQIIAGVFFIALGGIALIDGTLSVMDGAFIIAVFFLYIIYVSKQFKFFSALLSKEKTIKKANKMINVELLFEMLLKSALGIILILIASNLLVDAAVEISSEAYLNIDPTLVGIFVFAVGTNIPELTFLFRAEKKNEVLLSLGNIAGSTVMNTLILGVLAVISGGVDLSAEVIFSLTPILVAFVATLFIFVVISITGEKITRREGYFLLGIYLSLIIGQGLFMLAG